jgi:hypothetical protein
VQLPLGEAKAQQVPLLREQERVLTDEQCAALLKKINFLRDPGYAQKLRNSLESVGRMARQAEQGQREADERLRRELTDQAKDFLDDLAMKGVEKLELNLFRREIQRLHEAGVLPAAQRLLIQKKAIDLGIQLDKLLGYLDTAAGWYDQGMTLYLRQITEASKTTQAAQEADKSLYDQVIESGAPKWLGERVAQAGGPLTEIGFKLGYLAVTAGPIYGESYYAGQSLAQLKESMNRMSDQLQRIELDRNMYEHQYDRDCKPTPSTEATTSPETPAAPTPASKAGGGISPWVWILGGAAVVGGVGAAALAAGRSGSTSSSSGGSRTSAASCSSGLFCRTSTGKTGCCPSRINGQGFIGLCPNSNACVTLAPFQRQSCPGGGASVNCCPGPVDCGVNRR